MARKRGLECLRRNKKGSLIDILFIGLIALIFSVVVVIGLKVTTSIGDEINERTDLFDSRTIDNTNLVITKYENSINNAFLFLIVGVAIVSLVLAALVRVHPMFIPFFFIGWIIVVFMSGIFSNIYQEMSANPELATTAASLDFINVIMTTLPMIVGIFGILLMLVMYKLWSDDQ